MPRLSNRRSVEEDGEGFYVSMSDMLTGLLFIFIILLVYYAVQFRQTTQEMTGANTARAQLLRELRRRLLAQDIKVQIDTDTGVLRLPDAILFDEGSADLSEAGKDKVAKLSDVLISVLPCYTDYSRPDTPCSTKRNRYRIDALFVEGHSDVRPLNRGGRDVNVELSANRAINTFRELRQRQDGLDSLKTKVGTGDRQRLVPILSVSGYGGTRPTLGHAGATQEDYRANRRIDLRFLMVTPDPSRFAGMLL
jgi:chemotaxis protein MotB